MTLHHLDLVEAVQLDQPEVGPQVDLAELELSLWFNIELLQLHNLKLSQR